MCECIRVSSYIIYRLFWMDFWLWNCLFSKEAYSKNKLKNVLHYYIIYQAQEQLTHLALIFLNTLTTLTTLTANPNQ